MKRASCIALLYSGLFVTGCSNGEAEPSESGSESSMGGTEGDAGTSSEDAGDGDSGDGDSGDGDSGDGDGDGDGDAPGGLDYASGTRLRAEVWRTDANTRLFRRWLDSEREEYCSFQETPSGRRCVPDGAHNWERLYADAGCTQPVVADFDTSCQGEPQYGLVHGEFDACVESRPLRVHAIGPLHEGPVYGVDGDQGCVQWDEANTYWTVGAAIDDAEFVGGQVAVEATEDASGRVAPARFEADDGSWRRTFVADTDTGQRMATRVLEDGETHFYMATAVMEWSAEVSCATPIAGAYDCGVQPAHVLEVGEPSGEPCEPTTASVYAVGAPYSGELYYGIGVCSLDSAENWPDYAFYEVEQPPLAASSLVTATRVNGTVEGDRLALDALGADDEAWMFELNEPVRLTDGEFDDMNCSFQLGADDELYCFPDHRGWSIAYADDTCSTPVARWLGGMGNGGLACLPSTPPAAFPISTASADACDPATVRAFALGEPIADQQVWTLNGQDQCVAGTVTSGLYGGEEIPLGDLAHAQLLIE